MKRTIFEPEHDTYRESVQRFWAEEAAPHFEQWEADGIIDRALFKKAAEVGMLAMSVPEAYGGNGVSDFRFNQIVAEEAARAGLAGPGLSITLHSDTCLPYFEEFCDDEQKDRWLPGIASGELVTAVAMTEPGIGSDLASMQTSAIRSNGHYVVNGSKTFITNGIHADLIITAVKTDPKLKHAGMSLVVLERGMEGFERGRNLEKIGMHSQDTAELFFNDVKVPVENLLGEEGQGFRQLTRNLAQERLSIACFGVGGARHAFEAALEYVKERTVFGATVGSFQNTKFVLAECRTEIELATQFVDQAVLQLNAGTLTPEDAAMAKWWCTELHNRVADRCLQLFGGYGYMTEYPISRDYTDARVTRLYGGTNEIMKEIIGRSMGL